MFCAIINKLKFIVKLKGRIIMSDNKLDNVEVTEEPEVIVSGEVNDSRPIADNIQYLIGGAWGLITCLCIYLSSADLGITDNLINKIVEYSFLIAFVAFMIGIRKIEDARKTSLRKTRTAFMIAIGVGVLVFLVMALSSGTLPFGKS